MAVDVSIIIPTYNRYPQIEMTLYALERQNFKHTKMEVIVVDDGSTDETKEVLSVYRAPFSFQYIRSDMNQGVSKARNLGISRSSGKVLIFLDAENLVDPDFVTHHYTFHLKGKNKVVNGSLRSFATFTVLDPRFTTRQLKRFYAAVKNKPDLLRQLKLNTEDGNQSVRNNNMRKLKKWRKKHAHPQPILTKKDIDAQLYKKLAHPVPLKQFRRVLRVYGHRLEGFQCPWIACVTRNVSLPKTLLDQAGWFDEDFCRGWGVEDWELGFRLYQVGAQFMYSPLVACYHQEHPPPENKPHLHARNYLTFLQKHPQLEVFLMGFVIFQKMNLLYIEELISILRSGYRPEHEQRLFELYMYLLKKSKL